VIYLGTSGGINGLTQLPLGLVRDFVFLSSDFILILEIGGGMWWWRGRGGGVIERLVHMESTAVSASSYLVSYGQVNILDLQPCNLLRIYLLFISDSEASFGSKVFERGGGGGGRPGGGGARGGGHG